MTASILSIIILTGSVASVVISILACRKTIITRQETETYAEQLYEECLAKFEQQTALIVAAYLDAAKSHSEASGRSAELSQTCMNCSEIASRRSEASAKDAQDNLTACQAHNDAAQQSAEMSQTYSESAQSSADAAEIDNQNAKSFVQMVIASSNQSLLPALKSDLRPRLKIPLLPTVKKNNL